VIEDYSSSKIVLNQESPKLRAMKLAVMLIFVVKFLAQTTLQILFPLFFFKRKTAEINHALQVINIIRFKWREPFKLFELPSTLSSGGDPHEAIY